MDKSALFKISYGLYVLTVKDADFDNGCIINTAGQITDNPLRMQFSVSKANLTHDILIKEGIFNLSVLAKDTPFWTFRHFGFQSGRTVNKFADIPEARTANGLRYAPGCTNAVISGKVVTTLDCGTHTLFIADVTDAVTLSQDPSMTYQDYFDYVKPKPDSEKKTGWVCKICGYVYEGEVLPEDYICPLCKHGAADFEKL